jgi:DNA-binding IclR family transcriptional regulator
MLSELARCNYVRQTRKQGDYVLTTKLVSLGLSYLSSSGIVDIAQPLLDRLAETSGELVRLSVVDGERLTWVARAQGLAGDCATTPTWVPMRSSRVPPPVTRGC